MASLGGTVSADSGLPTPKPAAMKPVPVLERLALRSQLLVAALTDSSTLMDAEVWLSVLRWADVIAADSSRISTPITCIKEIYNQLWYYVFTARFCVPESYIFGQSTQISFQWQEQHTKLSDEW